MQKLRSRKQSLDFRQEEVGRIMTRWRASDSCSLIGVGSVGKSNLLQHLVDPEVQAFYMDVANAEKFRAILVDPALLGAMPNTDTSDYDQFCAWAGYELLMHRLYLAFQPLDAFLHPDDAAGFVSLYAEFHDGDNPLFKYMGLRYLELGLEYFMRAGIQIVFMFDEFDEMLRQLPVKFFQALRGLRDINKKQLSYLTFTRKPILDVAVDVGMDLLDIEPFAELFTDSVVYVGPYNKKDARSMIQNLMKRNSKDYDEDVQTFLSWSTGGYAGLLRAGFRALETLENLDANTIMRSSEHLAYQLAAHPGVREECRTIWTSLSEDERLMLREIARVRPNINLNDAHTKRVASLLTNKRLFQVREQEVVIEPPVFHAFVKSNPDINYEHT
ncbi:MAG: hypothetical protein H6672_10170 [Anaerolineaceae bacterium]|nr:hypothetical protein [Anaerolineaceae bacterium]